MIAAGNTYHYVGPLNARRLLASRLTQPGKRLQGSISGLSFRAGSMDISDWRDKIDGLDEQIVRLLSQRAAAAVEIGKLKAKINVPIYEPMREQTVFEHVRSVNPGPLTNAQVQDIYERVMDVMRALQRQQP